jgi:hypothetical protein
MHWHPILRIHHRAISGFKSNYPTVSLVPVVKNIIVGGCPEKK